MPKTASGRKRTSTDQRLQIEKPMCSEKTEKKRFRRATFLPVDSQNCGSSGRQSSIHLPDLPAGRSGGAETVLCAIVVWVGWVGAAMGSTVATAGFPGVAPGLKGGGGGRGGLWGPSALGWGGGGAAMGSTVATAGFPGVAPGLNSCSVS